MKMNLQKSLVYRSFGLSRVDCIIKYSNFIIQPADPFAKSTEMISTSL